MKFDFKGYVAFVDGVIDRFTKMGAHFPAFWAIILDIATKTQEGLDLLVKVTGETPEGGLKLTLAAPGRVRLLAAVRSIEVPADDAEDVPQEVKNVEAKLKSLLSNHATKHLRGPMPEELKALGDGQLLRMIFAFFQANPQLMTLILSLFGIKLPGSGGLV